MTLKFNTIPSKTLSQSITSASTSFKLSNILGWDGAALEASDFGTQAFCVFRDSGNTAIEIMEFDPSTIASASISIVRRGLAFNADGMTTEVAANKLDWIKNETIVEIGTNAPHMYQWLKEYIDGIAIAGSPVATIATLGLVKLSAAPTDPDEPVAVEENDTRLPTQAENDAMQGSAGSPSSSNRYVTQDSLTTNATDQSQATQDSSIAFGEANATTKFNRVAQSFVAGNAKIRSVSLYKASNTGTFSGTVTVSIQSDSAGSPSGSDIASKTITNQLYNAYSTGEFLAILSSEASLTAGQTYWIVVAASTADNSNHPNLGYNTAGGYASGSMKTNNSTDGWVAASGDLYFKLLDGTAARAAQGDSSGIIPAAMRRIKSKLGTVSLANGTVAVSHGLGVKPFLVEASVASVNDSDTAFSNGYYDVDSNTYAFSAIGADNSSNSISTRGTSAILAWGTSFASSATISAVDENVVIFSANASQTASYKISG